MIDILNQLLCNASLAAMLAIAVSIAQRFHPLKFRPGLRHALWLVVVIKLVLPPMLLYPLGLNDWTMSANADAQAPSVAETDTATLLALQIDLGDSGARTAKPAEAGWLDLTMIGWMAAAASLLCTAGLLILSIARIRAISRLVRRAEPCPSWVGQLAMDAARRLNLSCVPDVRVVDSCVTPFLWVTSKRPVIVVPRKLIDSLDRQSIALIISHELAHYARRDHVTNSLVMLLGTLLWWNPIFWWAQREIRLVQELCCDAMVLATDSSRRKQYAQTLLRTVDFVASNDAIRTSPAPAFGSTATFRRRIEMICRSDLSAGTSTTVRVLTGALAVMLLSASPALGDQDDDVDGSGKTVAQLQSELREMNERLMKLDSLVEKLLDRDAASTSRSSAARLEVRRHRDRPDSDETADRHDDDVNRGDRIADANRDSAEKRSTVRRPGQRRVERSVRIRARGAEDVHRQMQETERELESAMQRGDDEAIAKARMKLKALAEALERVTGKDVDDVVVIQRDANSVNDIELEIRRNLEHGAKVAEEAVEIAMEQARKQFEVAREQLAESKGDAQITIREMQRAAEDASRGAVENAQQRIQEVIQRVMKDVEASDVDVDVRVERDEAGHEDIDIDIRTAPEERRKEKSELKDAQRERAQVADLKRLVEELRQEIKSLRAEKE